MNRNYINTGETYEPEIVDMVPQTRYSLRAQRQAVQLMEDTYLACGRDRCSAVLHRCALENLGSLSVTAEKLAQLTPEAAEEYWRIVRSYADEAIRHLESW